MSTKIKAFSLSLLRGVGLCLLWCFWLCMVLLAAGQLRVLVSQDFSLPTPAVKLIEWQLERNGVNLEFSSAILEPSGNMLVENPVFYTSGDTKARLASARFVYAKVDMRLLMFGRLEVSELRVSDLSLELPLIFSEKGETENVVRGVTMRLMADERFLEIKGISGEMQGVRFDAEGEFPLQEMPGVNIFDLKRREDSFLLKQYVKVARRISVFSKHLVGLESPRLSVDIEALNKTDAEVKLHLYANSGRTFSLLPNIESSGKVRAVSRGIFRWPGTEQFSVEVSAKIDKLSAKIPEERGGGSVVFREVEARLDMAVLLHSPYVEPQWLWVGAKALEEKKRGALAGPLILNVEKEGNVDVWGGLCWAEGRFANVSGWVDYEKKTGWLLLRAEVDNGVIEEVSRFAKQPRIADELKIFPTDTGMMAATASVEISFEGDWKKPRLGRAFVESGRLEIHGVELDQICGYAELDGIHLRCYDAFVCKGPSRVTGGYEMDIKSPFAFRFLLEGFLQPPDIKGWLKGEWWMRIWNDVVFPKDPGWANVDIQGQWKKDEYNVSAFIDAKGTDVLARAVPFDYAATRMFVRPDDLIDLIRIHGEYNEKAATSSVKISRKNESEKWSRIEYSLVTDLELTHQTELSHPAMTELAKNLWMGEVPHVEAQGWIEGFSDPKTMRQQGSASVVSRGPAKAWGVDLSDLSFDVVLSNTEVEVPKISARMAGGIVAGKAHLRGLGTDSQLRVSAAFNKMNMVELHKIIAVLREKAKKEPLKEREWEPGDWLSGGIVADGKPSDIYSFQGLGYVSMHAEKLGKVNLFGGLSEALRGSSFSLGGIELTDLNANFTLKGDIVSFKKMTVTGPSALINMRGAVDIRKQLVNFRAQLNPVSQTNAFVSSTVGVLMMPFSGLLEVKVQGPAEKPKWIFTRGPTNLIRSFSSSSEADLPPIEEDPKPDGPGFKHRR